MKRAVYVGNFDPVTLGHVDIIQRSVRIADQLVIGVKSQRPGGFMFSLEQRMGYLRMALHNLQHVIIRECGQDIVNFARTNGAEVIIRGVRNIEDFEHELHQSQINQKMNPGINTVLFMADTQYSFLSSGIVRELLSFDKDISCFVPKRAADLVKADK